MVLEEDPEQMDWRTSGQWAASSGQAQLVAGLRLFKAGVLWVWSQDSYDNRNLGLGRSSVCGLSPDLVNLKFSLEPSNLYSAISKLPRDSRACSRVRRTALWYHSETLWFPQVYWDHWLHSCYSPLTVTRALYYLLDQVQSLRFKVLL